MQVKRETVKGSGGMNWWTKAMATREDRKCIVAVTGKLGEQWRWVKARDKVVERQG